jgi:uncharacterized protein YecE (DUF72 family)
MIKVGCCGFAQARARYFRRFHLVEIDQTFYQPPQPKTAARWKQEAGEDFEFTVKAWQLITHPPTSPSYEKLKKPPSPRNLKNYGSFQLTSEVLAAWEETEHVAENLGARLIVFESPPSFVPEKTHIDNLTKFFGSVERRGYRMVWAPAAKWPEDLVIFLCRDLDLILACDPFLQRPLSDSLWYLRLQGKGNRSYKHTDRDLSELRRMVSTPEECYVLFDNEHMLADAGRFKKMLK